MNTLMLDNIIKTALKEDIGTGDITTLSTIDCNTVYNGRFIAKECGILCGLDVVSRVFGMLDKNIELKAFYKDGDAIKKGDIIAAISGSATSILTGERVALNFLQLMSGIASKTRACVEAVSETKAKICDTRKTTPGLRVLEKYAVKTGGGSNHRYNLSDGILIKDNHIKAAGGISEAINKARAYAPHTLKIEVEVEDFAMLEEALQNRADIIMLDNMSLEDMRKAVGIVNGRALVEASGNMGDKDLLSVANTGVDLISIGALTHTIRALDISLKF
ncbi:MAG: carboxylating nicotinate-nucleotide diphosphorylase [Clostridia bacterium]|nr:carboxylating nicotinate-nucleotide diphosphorylase [Clostridia bacterium]